MLLGIGLALFAFAWWIARKAVPEPPSPVPPMPPPVPPPGMRQRISIIVRSSAYPDADVKAYVVAQQAQISHEFAPAFGMDAEIVLEDAAVVTGWPVFLDETSDLAGALGYHDVTAAGAPFARVFLADSRAAGVAWQSVASHECLEILADPSTTKTVVGPNGRPWAYECFTGDTKIPLLDGTTVSIKDLVGRERVWVYSLNLYGSVCAGLASAIRRTCESAEIVEVRLDNGESIRCTPDHLFLLRDGSYLQASDLVPGVSLMPLYRRLKTYSAFPPYEQVYQPLTKGWVWTHHIAVSCPRGSHRHHRDLNRLNNSPENLMIVSNTEHGEIHGALPPSAAKRRANSLHMKELNANHRGTSRPELCVPHNVSQENRKASGVRGAVALRLYNASDAHRAIARENGRTAIHKNIWSNPASVAKIKQRGAARFREMNQELWHKILMQKNNHTRWHEKRDIRKDDCEFCTAPNNHKVIAVAPAGREDVYDLTVERYHNFALAAGVFVHNCGDPVEDVEYLINGVPMSDFVFPRWFAPGYTGQVDNRHAILRAFQVTPGGYAEWRDASGNWVEISGPSGRKARK